MHAYSLMRPRGVLFDRDGTLVVDVPYNDDPRQVRLMPTARTAVRLLREQGLPIGVVTNQSGIGRGYVSARQVRRVNRRIDALLGGFDSWQICPHAPRAGCHCRKPAPGLVEAAATELGCKTSEVVVVGDVGADVEAARAAGAIAVLVPTSVTLPEEVAAADFVAPTVRAAAERLLKGFPQ